jgi:hypothetical protein
MVGTDRSVGADRRDSRGEVRSGLRSNLEGKVTVLLLTAFIFGLLVA